jgi:hypothetical protein
MLNFKGREEHYMQIVSPSIEKFNLVRQGSTKDTQSIGEKFIAIDKKYKSKETKLTPVFKGIGKLFVFVAVVIGVAYLHET